MDDQGGLEKMDCRTSQRAVSWGDSRISPISMILPPYQGQRGREFIAVVACRGPRGAVLGLFRGPVRISPGV